MSQVFRSYQHLWEIIEDLVKILTPFENVTLQVSKEEASLSECIPYAHTLVSNITNIDTFGVRFPTFPIWLPVWPSQLTVYGNKNASFIQLCYFKYFCLDLHYIFVASIHRESSPPYWRGATGYWTGNVYSHVKRWNKQPANQQPNPDITNFYLVKSKVCIWQRIVTNRLNSIGVAN